MCEILITKLHQAQIYEEALFTGDYLVTNNVSRF